MNHAVEYFHPRVKAEIEGWPDSVLADYARIVELLMEFGPYVRMPHSRAMGDGLFELRPRGSDGIVRVFYCFVVNRRIVASGVYQEDAGYPGAGNKTGPKTDDGGAKWLT